MDAIDYFNGKKQGYDWCAVFICWLYYKACEEDVELTKTLLGQPNKSNYAAGAKYLSTYCDKVNVKSSGDCAIGDIVCYDYEGTGSYDHVGIIYMIDSKWIYVCQGNASNKVGKDYIHSATHQNVKGIYRPHWDQIK